MPRAPLENGLLYDDLSSADEVPPSSSGLGDRLRDLRRRQGLTLDDVGRNVGVTRACVCQWESGRSYPSRKFLPDLARSLETSVSYLLVGRTEEMLINAQAARLIRRARMDIAEALQVDVSRVRIEID